MCDKCQENEILINGMKMVFEEIRTILNVPCGDSIVQAIKDLKEKANKTDVTEEDLESWSKKGKTPLGLTEEEKTFVNQLIENENKTAYISSAYIRKIQSLLKSDLSVENKSRLTQLYKKLSSE
jgi:hypothetical protein